MKGESLQDYWRELSYAMLEHCGGSESSPDFFASRELLDAGLTGSSKATGFYLAAENCCCWEGACRIASVQQNSHR